MQFTRRFPNKELIKTLSVKHLGLPKQGWNGRNPNDIF